MAKSTKPTKVQRQKKKRKRKPTTAKKRKKPKKLKSSFSGKKFWQHPLVVERVKLSSSAFVSGNTILETNPFRLQGSRIRRISPESRALKKSSVPSASANSMGRADLGLAVRNALLGIVAGGDGWAGIPPAPPQQRNPATRLPAGRLILDRVFRPRRGFIDELPRGTAVKSPSYR